MEKVELSRGLRDGSAILNRNFWSQDFEEMKESVVPFSSHKSFQDFLVLGGRTWEKWGYSIWLKPEVPVLNFDLFI